MADSNKHTSLQELGIHFQGEKLYGPGLWIIHKDIEMFAQRYKTFWMNVCSSKLIHIKM